MKTTGVYYLPTADVLWYVTKVEYYEDLYNAPFSIIEVWAKSGLHKRVCIYGTQFDRFIRIGDL